MMKSSFWKSFVFFLLANGILQGAPIVTQISPQSGPEAGGTIVALTGSGFSGTTAVTFGTLPAASFIVNSDTSITATSPVSVFGNVNIFVTTLSGISQPQQANLFTYTGQWKAITGDIGSPDITVIDVSTNTVITTIPAGLGILNLSITPDGKTAYLLDTANNNVIPFDLATYTLGTPISAPSFPVDIAITPNGTTAYIANQSNGEITPINIATNTVQPPIVLPGQRPFSVAITPDGTRLYVADQTNGDVFLIDTATNTSLGLVFSGLFFPVDMAITPDGTKGYLIERGGGIVDSFDVATNTILTTIPVGSSPFGMAITPDGTKGYVANNGSDNVTVIDIATDTIIGGPISVGDGPIFPQATPDSRFVYVPNLNTNTVSVIETATGTVVATIVVGTNPRAVAITPDQAPAARFTATTANLNVTFDASSSTSPVGSIASYFWNFGDGQVLTTTTPIVSHTYSSSGSFVVTLQVVNTAGTSTQQVYSTFIVSKQGGPSAVTFLSLNIGEIPGPSNFIGKTIKNKFATQTDIIHQLRWTPSSVPVLNYFLFRNGEFIAAIPPEGPFIYNDHNRRKHEADVYELVALFATGQTSSPLITKVP